ncbi:MAG: ABC transporter substrate-binding protein [Nocardiopsaceae bacterium]|nr:ABC transporter substrate-binding protein [Nocardiopsaceae bacterium]
MFHESRIARGRRGLLSLGLALAVLVLAACGSSSGSGGSAAAGSPITIAISAPFTGDTADYGTQATNALKLAEKYYGSTINGHPIKMVQFDDKCTGSGAEIAIRNALAENPVLIDGPACSSGVSAVQKTVQSAGIPQLVGAYLPSLTTHGDTSFFRNVASDAQFAQVMTRFIKEKGYQRVAILAGTASFSAGEGQALAAALKQAGLPAVKDISYTDGDTDFSGQIQSLKSAKPDAVFLASYDPDGARACAQMKQLGLNAQCLGNESIAYADSVQAGGAALNGAYAYAPFLPTELTQFVSAWKQEFGSEPDDESYGLGYVGFAAALQAIKAAGPDPTPAKVSQLLHSRTFTVNLGIGKVRYAASGDNACATMYIGQLSDNGKKFNMVKNESLHC